MADRGEAPLSHARARTSVWDSDEAHEYVLQGRLVRVQRVWHAVGVQHIA